MLFRKESLIKNVQLYSFMGQAKDELLMKKKQQFIIN